MTRLRLAGLRRLLLAAGIGLFLTMLASVISLHVQPEVPADLIVWIWGGSLALLALWIVLRSRSWNRKYNLQCPNCGRWLHESRGMLEITGQCPRCSHLVIEDPKLSRANTDIPVPPGNRSVVGPRHVATFMLLSLAAIGAFAFALAHGGRESLVAGYSASVIAAAVCALVPLVLWRSAKIERVVILPLVGAPIGAVAVQLWQDGPLLRHIPGLGQKILLVAGSVGTGVVFGFLIGTIVLIVLSNIVFIRFYSDLRRLRSSDRA